MQLDLQAALGRALAGHYMVTREIGRGGMAVVYEAHDLIGDRDVAIKLLYPDLARALGGERFLREIRILQQLSHPNILPLLDSGSIELLPGLFLPWYAMPLAREETLRGRLTREGALPLPTALGYARDLCAALTHAHASGVIHRDIKPENILLVNGSAVLADFGIARAITEAGGETLSTTGIIVGTPAYMSPEQSTGARQLNGRSDLYSLGVVLYEMLAGHPPFSGSTPQAVSARHQYEIPPPIVVVRPGLPAGVPAVLERALAKLAPDRFENAAEFQAALATLPSTIHSPRTRRWKRASVALAGVIGGALLVGAVGLKTLRTDVASPAVAVVPFTADGVRLEALCGTECSTLVDDALSHWADFPRIDPLRVRNAVAVLGAPTALLDAERIARSVGAGRFIFGHVHQVGNELRLRVSYNQLQWNKSRSLGEQAVTIQAAGGEGTAISVREVDSIFLTLARELVAPPGALLDPLETASSGKLAALRSRISGDSALAEWDFTTARRRYREALAEDSAYAQAHLALAIIDLLADREAGVTESWASHAVTHLTRLPPRQQALATALRQLERAEYPAAAAAFREMLQDDSTDFIAWFGLGESLTRDKEVVEDRRSRSGFAFRGSLPQAMEAYDRALQLAPSAYAGYAGGAISRLMSRYFAEPTRLRHGIYRTAKDSIHQFAAAPAIRDDSLVFIPRPIKEVLNGQWVGDRTLNANEIGRRHLRAVTTSWVEIFPTSAAAWHAHALALELSGALSGTTPTGSALLAIRQARARAAGQHEALAMAVVQVRVLVKSGQFRSASSLADSLLDRTIPVDATENSWLASLAGLIGRIDLAARYAAQAADTLSFATPDGATVTVPPHLAGDGMRLLVYASTSGTRDSLQAVRHRLIQDLTALPASVRPQVRLALLDRPTLLAYPELGAPEGDGSHRKMEQALSRKDAAAAKAVLDSLVLKRQGLRPGDYTGEMTLLEARIRLALGDSTSARALVTTFLRNLDTAGLELLDDVPQAISIRGLLSLADSLTTPDVRASVDLRDLTKS